MLGACALRAQTEASEIVALALDDAVSAVRSSLAGSASVPDGKPVAILPIAGDDGSVIGLLKNALTSAGKTCVEGKEDPMWDEVLKEIAWDERKEDILDASTVDKLGALKSAQYLMYGSLRRLAASRRYALVELELHITCIATKQHVWGGTFARRHYAPGDDPSGAVDIPPKERIALVDGVRAKIEASLKKSEKLGAVKKVAILPMSGDLDRYAEGLLRDVLSASSMTPVNLDVNSRAEARLALREGAVGADALMYGVLRDVSASVVETKPTGEKTYSAVMEIQACIEKGATREILWSDTVQFATEFTDGPRGWWDALCRMMPVLSDHPSLVVWIPLGVVIGVLLLLKFIRAATRVR